MYFKFVLLELVCLFISVKLTHGGEQSFRQYFESFSKASKDVSKCSKLISQNLIDEIASYQPVANTIIDAVVNGKWKGNAYIELQSLVDLFPTRLSGSRALEDSIDFMIERLRFHGIDNVRGEDIPVPHWVRGEEEAEMLEPQKKSIPLLGLGTTVGTPDDGVTGDVLVVKSFADLDDKKDQAKGKIVVFNQGWQGSFEATKLYMTNGASHAAQYGAIATLIENVAPISFQLPHAGLQEYWDNATKIPTACITKEDADFIYKLKENGDRIRVHIKLRDFTLPFTTSRNLIGEIEGSKIKNEFVGVTSHIDSWDVGQGVINNAGAIISMMTLAVIKDLNLQPKRSLQAIVLTSEELGFWGVKEFAKTHHKNLENYSAVFGFDGTPFRPKGLDFVGSETAGCIVNEVLKLTASISATEYTRYPLDSSEKAWLQKEGVPGLSTNNDDDNFWQRNTEGDTIALIDINELDLNTALCAVSAYVLADISVKLPRDNHGVTTVN